MSFAGLVNISLAVVNCCLYNPLMVECRKLGCFIVKLMNIFIGAVWLQLQICMVEGEDKKEGSEDYVACKKGV